MSALSSPSDSDLFLYGASEQVNGFVAGLAGSSLRDEEQTSSPRRALRLSANSGSYEDPGCRAFHPSITEEISDIESEIEMKISDGSLYPEQFSLLNISDDKQDPDLTLDMTNDDTITLDEEQIKQHDLPVFSPVKTGAEFLPKESNDKDMRSHSNSSIESFGDFDEPWTSAPPPPPPPPPNLSPEEQVDNVAEICYHGIPPASLILHSSPKKLLDSNFVWSQARSNVTKPSYSWDKLKLHSYLLGALSVRQPISLNRLKPSFAAKPAPPTTPEVAECLSVTSSEWSVSPELGEPAECDSLGEIEDLNLGSSELEGCGENRRLFLSTFSPISTHRRSHSSPVIPSNVRMPSPGSRSVTSSPGPRPRGPSRGEMTKANSLESNLSPSSFDESHATRGLNLLQLGDIQTMRHEMKCRVSELSASLITEFQYRGDADHSKEVKKAFVSAFITAEEKKSKGQLSSRQKNLLPIVCNDQCPPTEILVLLTQLLNGLISDTPHTSELLKHYMYMLCKPCLDR